MKVVCEKETCRRLAGSDIHIMRNFGREFGGVFAGHTGVHRTVDLGRTFRSVDKIALAARRFVLCNPAQITKTVVPAGEAEHPAIRIAWTRRETGDQVLDDSLKALAAEPAPPGRKPTVLLLGRYRFIEPDMRSLRRRHPNLTITFKTIHASKGLEADHVVLLGADSARMGFPSMIVDDPLLALVSPEAEPFANAEERRVMYVAMTRARRTVTFLASEAYPSAFVTELLKDPAYDVASPREAQERTHTCGQCGGACCSCPALMAQAGTVASTSNTAATACPPVPLAAPGFRFARNRKVRRFAESAEPSRRRVRNAPTAGS